MSGPYHTCTSGTCAKAVSTVCTTFDEVHVMVGTALSARAFVFRLVLMYTTCTVQGGRAGGEGVRLEFKVGTGQGQLESWVE